MRQIRDNADKRQSEPCTFCRGKAGTKDHVPSKVFLDEPYPPELPVVFACKECNGNFSQDEAYLACLIECIKANSYNINDIERESIKTTLERFPSILKRIKSLTELKENKLTFKLEKERIDNVFLKLIKGHLMYEFSTPIIDEKIAITYFNLYDLNFKDRQYFENVIEVTVAPEVGCRAGQNMQVVYEKYLCWGWNIVQEGLYRYMVALDKNYIVRIVIGDFLACEAVIQD